MRTETRGTNIREDFPILKRLVHGKPLVYLDNAASTQKPRTVIEAMGHFYAAGYSNIHRGVYLLSEEATESYEQARIRAQHTRIVVRDLARGRERLIAPAGLGLTGLLYGNGSQFLAQVIACLLEDQFEANKTTEQEVYAAFDGETLLAAQTALDGKRMASLRPSNRSAHSSVASVSSGGHSPGSTFSSERSSFTPAAGITPIA
jgi:hypothetical protein